MTSLATTVSGGKNITKTSAATYTAGSGFAFTGGPKCGFASAGARTSGFAFTGSEAQRLGLLGMIGIGGGLFVVVAARKRRDDETSVATE